MNEHCWHNNDTGTGRVTVSRTGTLTERVRCCWCNAQAVRATTPGHVRLEGHGPHHLAERPIVSVDVKGPCPENRTGRTERF